MYTCPSSGEFLNMKPNLSSWKFFFTLSWSDMQGRMFIRCVFVTAVLSEQWGTTPRTLYFMSTSEDGSGKEKLLLWHEINLNYESVWCFSKYGNFQCFARWFRIRCFMKNWTNQALLKMPPKGCFSCKKTKEQGYGNQGYRLKAQFTQRIH